MNVPLNVVNLADILCVCGDVFFCKTCAQALHAAYKHTAAEHTYVLYCRV